MENKNAVEKKKLNTSIQIPFDLNGGIEFEFISICSAHFHQSERFGEKFRIQNE